MRFQLTIKPDDDMQQFEDFADAVQHVADELRMRSFLPIEPYYAPVRDEHGKQVGHWAFYDEEA